MFFFSPPIVSSGFGKTIELSFPKGKMVPSAVFKKFEDASGKGIYYVPADSHFSDGDSFIIVGDKMILFQVTVGLKHPYNTNRVKAKAHQHGCKLCYFVYLVPVDRYESFRYQGVQRGGDYTIEARKVEVLQYVAAFTS